MVSIETMRYKCNACGWEQDLPADRCSNCGSFQMARNRLDYWQRSEEPKKTD